jgi:hypothetical protein
MISNYWKGWMDHYAKLEDWPRIRTIRNSKAKLINDLEHSKLDADIAPYLGHTSDHQRGPRGSCLHRSNARSGIGQNGLVNPTS